MDKGALIGNVLWMLFAGGWLLFISWGIEDNFEISVIFLLWNIFIVVLTKG
jgi:hypothetical protein